MKNSKRSKILIVIIIIQGIGTEFGTEKCAMLIMKNGKRVITAGLELPN